MSDAVAGWLESADLVEVAVRTVLVLVAAWVVLGWRGDARHRVRALAAAAVVLPLATLWSDLSGPAGHPWVALAIGLLGAALVTYAEAFSHRSGLALGGMGLGVLFAGALPGEAPLWWTAACAAGVGAVSPFLLEPLAALLLPLGGALVLVHALGGEPGAAWVALVWGVGVSWSWMRDPGLKADTRAASDAPGPAALTR